MRAVEEEPEDDTERLAVTVSSDLKKRFKVHCARVGVSMTEVIETLLEGHLKAKKR